MAKNKDTLVALPLIVALLMVAVEPIVVKLGYKVAMKPFDLLVFRTIAAGITILPFCQGFRLLKGKELWRMIAISLLFLGTNVAIYLSLQYLTAITVITAVTTTPAFVAIVNSKRGKDQLGPTFWIGFLLCFIGVLLSMGINGEYGIVHSVGIITLLLAITGSTIYRTTMDQLTADHSPRLISNYIFLLNSVIALFLLPAISLERVDSEVIRYGFWLGFAAVIGNIAFLKALKVLGSTRISIIGILQRPLLVICSALILGERLGIAELFGIVLVLGGVQLAKVKRLPLQSSPEPKGDMV
ncbi:MAG: DMT family transporter [Proteobacteria bacterium]|nr:DMT family transporter [Pseudomonadota bacterium]